MSYPFSEIERKWQRRWDSEKTFRTHDDTGKPKYYILDMFPYPSGAGLHIGHPEGYTATDIIGRYKKMKGYNVLHPMGFDAFGLPTERYSMTTGIHPEVATRENIANFVRQLKMIGFGYDWDRVINTTDPAYFKWTQWMFLLIYNSWYDKEAGKARPIEELPMPEGLAGEKEIEGYRDANRLAYISMVPVNWCEELGTVLANEEVDEWKDKGYSVVRRPMRQWMIRITEYAQRLLEDLSLVDWPSSTMEMQKHWIGRSEGAEIDFAIDGSDKKLRVFTTRPDTIFGATYMVVAPEHPAVASMTTEAQKAKVDSYISQAAEKSDQERTEGKTKTGVFTGSYAVNPANSVKIPVLIADYVLPNYGTGAIMAVPGHDERDHEFAKALDMRIIQVVAPADGSAIDVQEAAYPSYGLAVNSESCDLALDGKPTEEAKELAIEWAEKAAIGRRKINYRLRDWLFSRQRYWGEPIPIMFFEDGSKRALDFDELPLTLPPVKEFKPAGTGESPLATVPEWIDFTDKKTGKKARLETNTMPQWSGSCWYYLRYIDPDNEEAFVDKDKESYWMGDTGVDLYVGGSEHAVLHLLYARFWHKVLHDYGYVSTKEPFKKLFHQGLIMGEDGRKMSKSLGNVVNPDDIIRDYGADALRLYLMFLGPLEASKPWSTKGIEGVRRFLDRSWRMIAAETGSLASGVRETKMSPDQEYMLNATIKKVAEDIESLSFNTAISQMMIFLNEFASAEVRSLEAMKKYVLILASFAPHMAEELWQILGGTRSVSEEDYPSYDEAKLTKQSVEFVVQVASKIRTRLEVKPGATQDEIAALALADETVQKFIDGKEIRKVIFVPDKLINFIV